MASRPTATVLKVAAAALFICLMQTGFAQRGGGHASFAAHGSPHVTSHFSGGFRASTSRPSFAPSRAGFAPRSFAARRQFMPTGMPGGNRTSYRPGFSARQPQYRSDRYRRPYRGPRRSPYVNTAWNIWPGWTVPYYIGYPDDYGYDYEDNGDDPTNQAQPYQEDAYNEAPYAEEPEPWPAYPPTQPVSSQTSAPPAQQETVTLIFKDGRQPEQIRNYMITGSTLYVLDQKRQEIPIKDLDLTATVTTNRGAGVDFQLPQGTR
ncbi:hypothetical protein ACFPT7_03925 [Acidicapsa dinghuensis]|uniref:Uncharacterized protein n=1 Tax=Acidicapsa dinghuensis TaxID=2218256 RepID=A0ABW1EDI8_9BACT|nr:hypothetical protein [Acidicapsa dinghuensis]